MPDSPPIQLKNVRVHNLKGVDLTLKSGELVVFTGVSGCGKSSLAFDTIYVEGQRRYIESLSHQARRAIGDLPKPEADLITGIAPTIAIEQKQAGNNPRSTVGTMTGIYDFLRVCFARIGTPYCPVSGEKLQAQSLETIVAELQNLPTGTKLMVLAPYARAKKSEFKEDFQELLAKGYIRLRIDGQIVELGQIERLDGTQPHDVDLVLDRIVTSPENKSRLSEAAKQALELGKGLFSIVLTNTGEERTFSQSAHSVKSGLSYPPLEPHHFSFNHPGGMCPMCHGLGISREFDLDKILDPAKSIAEDCCVVASSYQTVRYGNIYDNLARLFKFNVKTPWHQLPEKAKSVFLHGSGTKWLRMDFVHPTKRTRWFEYVRWQGVLYEARERYNQAKSDLYRKNMGVLMTSQICSSCKGARIQPYPAAVRLGGRTLYELTQMTIEELSNFLKALKLSPLEKMVGGELLKEGLERLSFLLYVGVDYLALERTAPTLSGGESQRVRLAAQIGAGLVGAIYVLDEPSIGLHPADHHKLIGTLKTLRDQGNTVLVVEHDADTMMAADCIVDVGPGAGAHGGRILAQGSVVDVMRSKESLTGGYLSGRLQIEVPKKRRSWKESIEILGAQHHNLRNVDLELPLGALVCVTGLSGSGKSSLIADILVPALSAKLHNGEAPVGKHKAIKGTDALDKIIAVDQTPIGRTPRSNAATYIKLFDDIRDLFAELPESKLRGLQVGHFSFNVREGSCSYCNGLGQVKLDMDFMEDVWVECAQCKGRRFEPDVLAVEFKGKNIHDILTMDVEHALQLFESMPNIRKKLEVLSQAGLDYLALGQPSTTLSGGEAQRIKLAKELVRPATGRTLYVFDEPTTGLHFHDVKRLVAVLQTLVEKGNSVLVIEHNMDLVKMADWVIEMGPGAGVHGGLVVAAGTPEQIAKKATPTGEALKRVLRKTAKMPEPRPMKREGAARTTLLVEGAEQNNLKSVNVEIPRGKITVFTGPSGSGKSSLALDTIYAEGQRRYTETLGAYAKARVKQLPKPKVERIEGLSPAIALEQKTGGLNPRSTIGTMTEVYDLLRVLYAHLGTAYCPETGDEIRNISKEYVVNQVLEMEPGEKIQVLAPLKTSAREEWSELVERLQRQGFLRIRLNGTTYPLDEPIPYEKHRKNELFLVVDRLVADKTSNKRLFESVEKAATLGGQMLVIATPKRDWFFNIAFAVEKTGRSYPPITPQTFSFNAESGMCQECQGLGLTYGAHLAERKDFLKLSPLDAVFELAKEKATSGAVRLLERVFKAAKIEPDTPLKSASPDALHRFLNGAPEAQAGGLTLRWIGFHTVLANLARMGLTDFKETLQPFLQANKCPACQGERLGPLARNVRIQGRSIGDLGNMPLESAIKLIDSWKLERHEFLTDTLTQLKKSLKFLLSIGLGYLSLSRSAPTLSGGELQRIRLARQLGCGLTSCLYVLDEPTIGLHPYNNELLNDALKRLRDDGNTLIIVEHDPLTVRIADWIVDFGPHAGAHGGQVVAEGTLSDILRSPTSLTGAYLSGRKSIPWPLKRRQGVGEIRIENAATHNLQHLNVTVPRGAITTLTGVSGSGKSSLMRHLLKGAAELAVNGKKGPIEYMGATVSGLESFEKVVTMDQSPIGQTARADVSTYTDLQPLIRSHYASLPGAVMKGLRPGHFSPNHKRGMCRTCWGLGYKTVDLQFLPAVQVPCEGCKGFRLNPVSLEVQYKGKHFGEVLRMSVEAALQWFEVIPRIARRLKLLVEVGLGYLHLGQELATLSGGEAQRLRLSRELAKRETGRTLYLIDEPTVGLHSEDVARLIPIFHALADKKNTLVIIEHNLDVIKNADYVIDLGPDAGPSGGKLMAAGTPEEVAKVKASRTAPFLSEALRRGR